MRGQPIPTKTKNLAISMRKRGETYTKIMARTGLSKSSLNYVLKDVVLSKGAQKVIAKKRRDANARSAKLLGERRRKDPKYAARLAAAISVGLRQNSTEAVEKKRAAVGRKNAKVAMLAYRKTDQPIRAALRPIFGQTRKEAIDTIVVSYATKKHLVLVARSEAQAHHVTKRFAVVSSTGDKRKRVAYIPRLGGVNERRLTKLGVEVRSLSELGDV